MSHRRAALRAGLLLAAAAASCACTRLAYFLGTQHGSVRPIAGGFATATSYQDTGDAGTHPTTSCFYKGHPIGACQGEVMASPDARAIAWVGIPACGGIRAYRVGWSQPRLVAVVQARRDVRVAWGAGGAALRIATPTGEFAATVPAREPTDDSALAACFAQRRFPDASAR